LHAGLWYSKTSLENGMAPLAIRFGSASQPVFADPGSWVQDCFIAAHGNVAGHCQHETKP
jgi:hypothetical protein